MWGDPDAKEERQQKRLYRVGKSAAYSIGGGLGLWLVMLAYPHEGARAAIIDKVFSPLGWLLVLYGCMILATIVINKKWALALNMLMIWFVIPACLFYIFVNNWPG